jgi:secondary thiamine-phosphate synthase enzyme
MLTVFSSDFTVETDGIRTYEITGEVERRVRESGVQDGLVTVLVQHTSASLILFENADPTARADLEQFFRRLVPENADYFRHDLEGSDDMPSHIRMVLTRSSETIPVRGGRLQLGTWQGLFLYEHRRIGSSRHIALSVLGTSR